MTPQTADLSEQIAQLIEEVLYVEPPAPDADLIASGLIDSLALVSLITEVEDVFAIRLPLDDFDIDGFRTVEQIAAVVARSGAAA